MADEGRSREAGTVTYNVDRILDAHTHLTGRESAEDVLECMDFCGIEKAFVFAPMLDVQRHEITSDSLDDIRTHNDYCADICSKAPDRLLGFCTLNPLPDLEACQDPRRSPRTFPRLGHVLHLLIRPAHRK